MYSNRIQNFSGYIGYSVDDTVDDDFDESDGILGPNVPFIFKAEGKFVDTLGFNFLRNFFSSRKHKSKAILISPQALKNFNMGYSSWQATKASTSVLHKGCDWNNGGCMSIDYYI